ncbi:hypothetical protein [Acidovorax delafieldii]|uniref:hypothetical protein n=1 Tax=Acidovorax delafieldii TaxID=47920 RepID=UPI003ECE0F9A
MFDAQQVAGAIGSLKAAVDIAKAVMGAKIDFEVKEKVFAIQQSLLDAQQAMFSMQEALAEANKRTRQAENALQAANNWDQEKGRYKLFTPYTGAVVFGLKESAAQGEVPHYICTNCFEQRVKSILSYSKLPDGFYALRCSVCKRETPTHYRSAGSPKYVPE